MMHPDTQPVRVDKVSGVGVAATRFIPKGTITWALDPLDQILSIAEVARLPALCRGALDEFAYVDRMGSMVLAWDLGRIENHSCDPTCLMTAYEFEIAVRDIEPGDELTTDYGALSIVHGFECKCASPVCRRFLARDDLERHAKSWDIKVRDAFPLIPSVAQPLWSLVLDPARVERALAHPEDLVSCATNIPVGRGTQRV